jgi:hypothetical protein
MGEDDKRWGCGDCMEEDNAERMGTGAAEAMADVLVLGLVPKPASRDPTPAESFDFSARDSSWAAFLFLRSIEIGSPGRTWARAPNDQLWLDL